MKNSKRSGSEERIAYVESVLQRNENVAARCLDIYEKYVKINMIYNNYYGDLNF